MYMELCDAQIRMGIGDNATLLAIFGLMTLWAGTQIRFKQSSGSLGTEKNIKQTI